MVFEPEAAVFHHAAPSGGCRVSDQAGDPTTGGSRDAHERLLRQPLPGDGAWSPSGKSCG